VQLRWNRPDKPPKHWTWTSSRSTGN